MSYLTDCGALAVTAEMVGAGSAILGLTSDYAKQRIQFGKPIGQYQGVKHRLADMYVDLRVIDRYAISQVGVQTTIPKNWREQCLWLKAMHQTPLIRLVLMASAYTVQLALLPNTTHNSFSNGRSGPPHVRRLRFSS